MLKSPSKTGGVSGGVVSLAAVGVDTYGARDLSSGSRLATNPKSPCDQCII